MAGTHPLWTLASAELEGHAGLTDTTSSNHNNLVLFSFTRHGNVYGVQSRESGVGGEAYLDAGFAHYLATFSGLTRRGVISS